MYSYHEGEWKSSNKLLFARRTEFQKENEDGKKRNVRRRWRSKKRRRWNRRDYEINWKDGISLDATRSLCCHRSTISLCSLSLSIYLRWCSLGELSFLRYAHLFFLCVCQCVWYAFQKLRGSLTISLCECFFFVVSFLCASVFHFFCSPSLYLLSFSLVRFFSLFVCMLPNRQIRNRLFRNHWIY